MLRLLTSRPVLLLLGIALARWVMKGYERPDRARRIAPDPDAPRAVPSDPEGVVAPR